MVFAENLTRRLHIETAKVDSSKPDKWIIVMYDYNPFTHMQ